ncbi:DNA/RNA non-specific endonuclease [Muriicola marianensis]|uniref:Endonuclease n=1 Tax=Muriicola marianensis TaxID=1324801 RepID=A0ABQ1R2B6_9FLAO|nr:DNA/RNA non-specific endonuclease [Muriicola marianensis]GGD53839.1 endonuclease [Muriicola marianensis]
MRRTRKNRIIYTVLLAAVIILFWVIEQYFLPWWTRVEPDQKMVLPEFVEPGTLRGDVIKHAFYSLEYSEQHEQARWVAYTLTRSHLTNDDRRRPFFEKDPWVKTASADWRNYKNSGYDRGHLCPAGDRRFSESAYNETFYTSNISPMDPDFNAGVWNRLEIQVRNWARKYDTLYVITGGVLRKGLPSIGYEEVSVPRAFYKIVVRQNNGDLETVAFLIPHRETSQPLEAFRVSIDQLEEETGIDFFKSMEDRQEDRLEEAIEGSSWPF